MTIAGRLFATHRVRTSVVLIQVIRSLCFRQNDRVSMHRSAVVEKFEIIPYIFRKRTSGFRRRVYPTTDRTFASCPLPNVIRTLIDVINRSYSIHRSRPGLTRSAEKVTIGLEGETSRFDVESRKKYVTSLTAQLTFSPGSYLGNTSP